MVSTTGTVYLVGAGPGDPGLLTLRGAEALAEADLLVYDALVSPETLALAPKSAERLYAGKRADRHAIPQGELNKLLIERAREGKTVVRLKGGDPYIFGRGGEEAEELRAAGVPFEVVPGISSIVAAPNYAGVPLTHREHCSSFTVFTGHEDPEKEASSLDYAQIARLSGTKVVLMGVERIGAIMRSLREEGLDPETPVAMVRWGTTGRQRTITGTVATIADVVTETGFKAPAVTVIGDVVDLRPRLNWFEARPLFGQRIVVTRTRTQASQLSKQLVRLGAEALEIPTIRIEDPTEKSQVVHAMEEINSYEWIVFTSPNGVERFFEFFFRAFEDIRAIGGARIAAVGPATAAKLREFGLAVDLTPKKYVASEISTAFREFQNMENVTVLLPRAEVANEELPRALEGMGAIVDDIPVYRTVPETEDVNGAAARFEADGAEWVTFTSSSTVENFNARFPLSSVRERWPDARFASIGPETTKAIQSLGLEPDLEATESNISGLVSALVDRVTSNG